MGAGERALEVLRTRFAPDQLRALAGVPPLVVVQGARVRRARALTESRLVETEESRRETPVIRALHAFCVEQVPEADPPWDGSFSS